MKGGEQGQGGRKGMERGNGGVVWRKGRGDGGGDQILHLQGW